MVEDGVEEEAWAEEDHMAVGPAQPLCGLSRALEHRRMRCTPLPAWELVHSCEAVVVKFPMSICNSEDTGGLPSVG